MYIHHYTGDIIFYNSKYSFISNKTSTYWKLWRMDCKWLFDCAIVCVHIYVCTCLLMHIAMCMHVCVCMYVLLYVCEYMFVCIWVLMHVCTWMCIKKLIVKDLNFIINFHEYIIHMMLCVAILLIIVVYSMFIWKSFKNPEMQPSVI